MKDFFKMMLASALGFIIANIILSIVAILFFFGMMSSIFNSMSNEKVVIENNSVLHLPLNGVIKERVAEDDPFTSLFLGQGNVSSIGLNDITSAIRKAKNNGNIKGIYIDSRMIRASKATLSEIRQELENFKTESGKFIVAYSDAYLQDGYYLASVADKVVLNPQGSLMLSGLASMPVFYKDALDKLGIKTQIFKVGTYKSAVEPLIQNKMSDANREQVDAFLNDMWAFIKSDIASSRNISEDAIDTIANQMTMMQPADFMLANHLVDTLLYETDMKNYLRSLLELSEDDKIPSVSVADMKSVKGDKAVKSKNRIALLYAEGNIVSGNSSIGIQDKYMVNQIEKLKKDDNIKAVVFRVNSGGGSAYASEQIWKAISELKEAGKPVVASLGDYAASGGYYISCNASKIVAQPTTLTGSIGIFGIIPNFEGTAKKIGVNTDVVKTNNFADFGNIMRPLNEQESQYMQGYIERGYDLFVTRCAEGRNMPKDSLLKYAEGRVWTGNQAKKIGLVDELGNIKTAIDLAAELAELGTDYAVYEYPRKRSKWQEILKPNKNELAAETLKEYLGDSYNIFSLIKDLKEQDFVQARMPYELNIQ